MSCFKPKKPRKTPSSSSLTQETRNEEETKNVRHDILLRIPECRVHLMDEGEAVELAVGDFEVQRISDESVPLATAIKVGGELQWPLTKDEPVVKLDALHYLFSLPMKDGLQPLSYGVAFAEKSRGELGLLDSFLKENSLFTTSASSSSSATAKRKHDIDWMEFAPAVDDYNNVLAKAIAGGTGHIVKGIFKCSNAYTNQVQKGGETMITRAVEEKGTVAVVEEKKTVAVKETQKSNSKKKGSLNKSLKRARKLSKMTEKLSKTMLNVVEGASGSVLKPVVQSKAGKTFLSMVPGEVLLASLDALNKILDAAEAAEKQAMKATSGAVTTAVTNRYGESAGEATDHALATAGHCAGTAWNIFKIRKAINPASATGATGVLKTAAKSVKL
ncbi:Senescence/dehydration-associated protein-like protein [Perilla frutescens var. hirtella]|nr:Senescence/dehydration-associated protein-like protein [Perilla frutescens var. hirtella]KAH6806520.1 Senescence/dehydration-associated protein-like protein [Perilla frutescens var. frutescens]